MYIVETVEVFLVDPLIVGSEIPPLSLLMKRQTSSPVIVPVCANYQLIPSGIISEVNITVQLSLEITGDPNEAGEWA